jgi:hypothetical protein
MNHKPALLLAALLYASAAAAAAAPRIESVVVKPNPAVASRGQPPEVEIAVTLGRTRFDAGGCEIGIDMGDGTVRQVEFGIATTRTLRHVYSKNGRHRLRVNGAGKVPCAGSREVLLTVSGVKAATKKEAKKKAVKKEPAS